MDDDRLAEMKKEISDEKAAIERRKEEKRRDDKFQTLYEYIDLFPDKIKPPKETRTATEYETISTWWGLRKKRGEAVKWDTVHYCPECGLVAKADQWRDGSNNLRWLYGGWIHIWCKCGWEYVDHDNALLVIWGSVLDNLNSDKE